MKIKSFEIAVRDVHCPSCGAKPGSPCTQPDDKGRHPVRTFHLTREDHAQWLTESPGPFEDKQGDFWSKGSDGLLHAYETAPFILEHVEKKWGPLTSVPPDVMEVIRRKLQQHQRDEQVCQLCGKLRRYHTAHGDCPGQYEERG